MYYALGIIIYTSDKIMNIRCNLFKAHNWQQVKAFTLQIVDKLNDPNQKVINVVEPWTGYTCSVCGKRKISQNDYIAQHAQVTQCAYDWLNHQEKRSNLLKQLGDNDG